VPTARHPDIGVIMKTKKICLIALPIVLVLFVVSYAVFRFSDAYPWEYLIEKEVRLQRIETRKRIRLDRLIGYSKNAVIAKMGHPGKTETRKCERPGIPMWGPGEGLCAMLKPGQRYEEWRYPEGLFTYLIWFTHAGEEASDPEEWRVIATGIHREGVVY